MSTAAQTADGISFFAADAMPLPNGGAALGCEVEVTAHLELTRTH